MPSTLAALRRSPQPTPGTFLRWQPGCWILFHDDAAANDAARSPSLRSYDPVIAQQKQLDRCAVRFTLQAFGAAPSRDGLLCYRSLGVNVDFLAPGERYTLRPAEIDRRKEEYLTRVLLPFPLKPHWLIETRHGFHIVFRILPRRDHEGVRAAAAVNRRLVEALGGNEDVAMLTQALRVPATLQFTGPAEPFLCRLLVDRAGEIAPYDLGVVTSVLNARDINHGIREADGLRPQPAPPRAARPRWRSGPCVTPDSRANAAASIVGVILRGLPEALWEAAGWGALKEWNGRTAEPLPEWELRKVFDSAVQREPARRGVSAHDAAVDTKTALTVQVEVRVTIPRPANYVPPHAA